MQWQCFALRVLVCTCAPRAVPAQPCICTCSAAYWCAAIDELVIRPMPGDYRRYKPSAEWARPPKKTRQNKTWRKSVVKELDEVDEVRFVLSC